MIPKELSWRVERLVSKESWVEQGDFLPLNVTYQLLAGAPCTQQSESERVKMSRSVGRLNHKTVTTSLIIHLVLCDKVFKFIFVSLNRSCRKMVRFDF